jgi:TonB family protein
VIAPFPAITAAADSANPPVIAADKAAEHILTKVPPQYPPDAKKARIQGTVTLKAIIGEQGTVENLSVVSGPAALQQSSLDAVRQWTYKPFVVDGKPTAVETSIHVIYTLKK